MTTAETRENLFVALDTLRSRKVRSALTILGIVIGVTSVISVAAIIEGLNGYIQRRVESMGSRTFFISRIPIGTNPLQRMPEKIRQRRYLRFDDGRYLEQTVPSLAYATVFANRINFGQQADHLTFGDQHVERIILRGVEPDYAQAVSISTTAAQKELVSLGLIAVLVPILVGFLLGVEALGGFLAGIILSGQLMAVFQANAGGAWDNAKKYIEEGNFGGKHSDPHKAAVVGDTVGDPLKDTAGPALNPMIKVINLVSLIIAPIIVTIRTPGAGLSIGLILAMAVCLAALIWAIWQSKREAESMTVETSAPATTAKQV